MLLVSQKTVESFAEGQLYHDFQRPVLSVLNKARIFKIESCINKCKRNKCYIDVNQINTKIWGFVAEIFV